MDSHGTQEDSKKRSGKRWLHRAFVLKNVKVEDLQNALNGFYSSGNFVISTQLFQRDTSNYDAVIHYKSPPQE